MTRRVRRRSPAELRVSACGRPKEPVQGGVIYDFDRDMGSSQGEASGPLAPNIIAHVAAWGTAMTACSSHS